MGLAHYMLGVLLLEGPAGFGDFVVSALINSVFFLTRRR